MPSERVQRRIDRLLDEADAALTARDWRGAAEISRAVLSLDSESADARAYLAATQDAIGEPAAPRPPAWPGSVDARFASGDEVPTSFANGRYEVREFLGEGGEKRVYLAHDTTLDRDVAFALIKTEGFDDTSKERITREAQAMGRLGTHPNIVTVFDLGEPADGSPYMVTELMGGGDIEDVLEDAEENRLSLDRIIEIGKAACEGLEFAHARGIVHRDLKPGNVWLTDDGIAKIGDFNRPSGLTVDKDGDASLGRQARDHMITNLVAMRLREMTSLEPQKRLRWPTSVRSDSEGRMYIADAAPIACRCTRWKPCRWAPTRSRPSPDRTPCTPSSNSHAIRLTGTTCPE